MVNLTFGINYYSSSNGHSTLWFMSPQLFAFWMAFSEEICWQHGAEQPLRIKANMVNDVGHEFKSPYLAR